MTTELPLVLVVDDDPDTRSILVRMLVPLGVNVLEAANGRQALSILKKQSIDVVLSDLVMPRMSGLMLLHSMLEQGHQIPFVLISGFSDKDSAIQALRLGAFDYLEKPIHESDLQSVMAEALKVGREQQSLLSTLRRAGQAPGEAPPDERNAELHIMKMRTIRYKGESYDDAVSRGNLGNWNDLKELFLREAEPQLAFAEGAAKGLMNSEDRSGDLTFLLRVFQTARMASEALRLNAIAERAWVLESFVAELRRDPPTLMAGHARLLLDGMRHLHHLIRIVADPEARATLAAVDEATEALRLHRRSA